MMERMILSQKTKLLHYRLKTYHWGLCLLLFCFFFNLLLFFVFKRIKFSFLRIILGHQHVRRYVTPYNNQGSKEN